MRGLLFGTIPNEIINYFDYYGSNYTTADFEANAKPTSRKPPRSLCSFITIVTIFAKISSHVEHQLRTRTPIVAPQKSVVFIGLQCKLKSQNDPFK